MKEYILNNKGETFYLLFMFICVHVMGISFLNDAQAEQRLREKLNEIGIPTQAIVKECPPSSKTSTCRMEYQYQVFFSNGLFEVFIDSEEIDCRRCKRGQRIMIKYLADNPETSVVENNNPQNLYRAWGWMMLAPPYILLVYFFIKKIINK